MTRRAGEYGLVSTLAVWSALAIAVSAAVAQPGGLEITFEPLANPPLKTAPPIEGGFPLQLVLDEIHQLQPRELQQLDRLLKLRRHHQLLGDA